MATSITLAQNLSAVFAKLDGCMPMSEHNAPTLMQVWTNAFGGENTNGLDLIIHIGEIAEALNRIYGQIGESKLLSSDEASAARETLDKLRNLLILNRFHENSFAFKNFCNASTRGYLTSLGKSLRDEFAEPKIEKTDVEELIAKLTELKSFVSASNIPIHLRSNLNRHLATMLWWLANPEMVSVQDLLETAGSALIISSQIKHQAGETKKEKDEAEGVFDRVSELCKKLSVIAAPFGLAYEVGHIAASEALKYIQ